MKRFSLLSIYLLLHITIIIITSLYIYYLLFIINQYDSSLIVVINPQNQK